MSRTAKAFVLSDNDLTALNQFVTKGKASVRKINRARILLLSHQNQSPTQISLLLGLSVATVYTVRNRYTREHLERALTEKARPGQPRKVASVALMSGPHRRPGPGCQLLNDVVIALPMKPGVTLKENNDGVARSVCA